jgi:hypothetical protein
MCSFDLNMIFSYFYQNYIKVIPVLNYYALCHEDIWGSECVN